MPGRARIARGELETLNPTAVSSMRAGRGKSAATLLDLGLYDPDSKILDVRRWLKPRR